MTDAGAPRPGRRERRRAQTTEQILEAARRRLTTDGAASVTLRAIARDLDTGVASLYRYFASRDALITELLVEAYDSQADAVAAAAGDHPDAADALLAAVHAYRSWSLTHPTQFALAYGTPLPGYEAPPERTVGPGVRVGGLVIGLVSTLWRDSRLDPARVRQRDADLSVAERRGLEALAQRRGYDVPVALLSLVIDLLVRIHGFVGMEVFGQLRPITSAPADTFARTARDALTHLGLAVEPSTT